MTKNGRVVLGKQNAVHIFLSQLHAANEVCHQGYAWHWHGAYASLDLLDL